MGGRWRTFKLEFICFLGLILFSILKESSSINLEGTILLKFRSRIHIDPYNSLANWDARDECPCNWLGVHCVEGEVHMLNLGGLSLGGTLARELGYLENLRVLMLRANQLSGAIPVEFGYLTKLEILDLSENNLNGIIPAEIAKMLSLKELYLCDNNFENIVPPELEDHGFLAELQFDECLRYRQFGHRPKIATESRVVHGANQNSNLEASYEQNMLEFVSPHRKLSEESNVEALPAQNSPFPQASSPSTLRSSGSYPALVDETSPSQLVPSNSSSQPEKTPPQSNTEKGRHSQKVWVGVAIALGVLFLLIVSLALYFMWRSRCARPIGPFRTGISGQLQKAFITGVPKLNRGELEAACEDFSNIIASCSFDAFIMYKGTLSSGVEIAVASTLVTSSLDWSEASELAYRKKIETLSRVNHKNYVNLLGYCEENEPFTRMMVFEYAPSGSFFEHLHGTDLEHLDWNARVRVVMGVAYCLQYMHHDLNPPVVHSNLQSSAILLTDDYAAKLAESPFEVLPKVELLGEEGLELTKASKTIDTRQNVYEFGILFLEAITGRLVNSEEEGSLVNWAFEYLSDNENNKDIIDPTLKSVKTNELDVICDVILECINPDPSKRPTMKEVITMLREVIPVTPEAAVPRLSPLWWAELEILSVEAT